MSQAALVFLRVPDYSRAPAKPFFPPNHHTKTLKQNLPWARVSRILGLMSALAAWAREWLHCFLPLWRILDKLSLYVRSPTGRLQGISKPGDTADGEETLFQRLESRRGGQLWLCLQGPVPGYQEQPTTHKERALFTNWFSNQECWEHFKNPSLWNISIPLTKSP